MDARNGSNRASDSRRPLSLVFLLRQPVFPDRENVRAAAIRAWSPLLPGDGSFDPAVEAFGPNAVPEGEARLFAVHGLDHLGFPDPLCIGLICCSVPYTDEDSISKIEDLRKRYVLEQHRAWIACDFHGPRESLSGSPAIEHRFYLLASRFLRALVPSDYVVGAYLPDRGYLFQANEDFWRALATDDPLESLCELVQLPVCDVAENDEEMERAMEEARRRFPEFVQAFLGRRGESHHVKAPLEHHGRVEHIWIEVDAIEGNRIVGRLANDPIDLGPLRVGDGIVVDSDTISDWLYIDENGQMVGGFTIAVLNKRMSGS